VTLSIYPILDISMLGYTIPNLSSLHAPHLYCSNLSIIHHKIIIHAIFCMCNLTFMNLNKCYNSTKAIQLSLFASKLLTSTRTAHPDVLHPLATHHSPLTTHHSPLTSHPLISSPSTLHHHFTPITYFNKLDKIIVGH
jgi:hypothetical protein